jgi:phytoene synthase
VVSTDRKLKVLARTLFSLRTEWAPARKLAPIAQLDETRFLIEAVATTPRRHGAPEVRSKPIEDRVVWVIDLFARLEQRDRLQRAASVR